MIGVIADDLTGAAEIGALGWAHGLNSEVVCAGQSINPVDLVCVDTNSRLVAPEKAVGLVAEAAEALRLAGAQWIYKKVDSVLRGHVLAEVNSILRQLGMTSALIVPANPRSGRTIKDGLYFIKGSPIEQTEFRNDPQFPRRSAKIHDLLDAEPTQIGVKLPGAEGISDGVVVGEASSTADTHAWAERRSLDSLLCGGAEFFEALLEAEGFCPESNKAAISDFVSRGKSMFICGTLSRSARNFVDDAGQRAVPVLTLQGEAPDLKVFVNKTVQELNQHATIVLVTPSKVECNRSASNAWAESLVRAAVEVLGHVDVHNIFVEGGTTAAHLISQLNWQRMKVLRQVGPGVVTLLGQNKDDIWLTIKPGSYPWPNEISRLVQPDIDSLLS